MNSDGYEYDVFVSYRSGFLDRDGVTPLPTRTWTREVFAHELRKWLAAEVGLGRVFVERDEIGPGARWPEDLANKLLRSKVLVAVLDATYRGSEWCMSELRSMLQREESLGLSPRAEDSLVIPVRFADGDFFPDEIRQRAPVDLHRYASLGAPLSGSERYLELVDEIRALCARVAGRIRNPPPWDAAWPVIRHTVSGRPPFAKPEL